MYRFNAVFFDGHVETLDAGTGMNPQLWIPKSSLLTATEVTEEAQALYMDSDKLRIN